MKLDGSAPLLLYGYGSYGISIPPTFSLEPSGVARSRRHLRHRHIRGGGELGEPWRDAGRMMNKINTFTDFIAWAEHLVKQKYTSNDRLVIQGGSAGGMLMGAVTNMRPDLFKAVVAQVPFVDVLNTMLDASLPLTTSEYIEWGNPNEKAGLRLHEEVFALRQRQGADVSGDAGEGFAQRQPGAVLGRREARGEASRAQDRQAIRCC